MRYLLDTNICTYVLRERPMSVKARFDAVGADSLSISTIVLAELYFGAARHREGAAIRSEVNDFASRVTVIPWDRKAAEHYGDIRAALEKRGAAIGAMDMMIAAHARSLGATLVSRNGRHFAQIPDLLCADWV